MHALGTLLPPWLRSPQHAASSSHPAPVSAAPSAPPLPSTLGSSDAQKASTLAWQHQIAGGRHITGLTTLLPPTVRFYPMYTQQRSGRGEQGTIREPPSAPPQPHPPQQPQHSHCMMPTQHIPDAVRPITHLSVLQHASTCFCRDSEWHRHHRQCREAGPIPDLINRITPIGELPTLTGLQAQVQKLQATMDYTLESLQCLSSLSTLTSLASLTAVMAPSATHMTHTHTGHTHMTHTQRSTARGSQGAGTHSRHSTHTLTGSTSTQSSRQQALIDLTDSAASQGMGAPAIGGSFPGFTPAWRGTQSQHLDAAQRTEHAQHGGLADSQHAQHGGSVALWGQGVQMLRSPLLGRVSAAGSAGQAAAGQPQLQPQQPAAVGAHGNVSGPTHVEASYDMYTTSNVHQGVTRPGPTTDTTRTHSTHSTHSTDSTLTFNSPPRNQPAFDDSARYIGPARHRHRHHQPTATTAQPHAPLYDSARTIVGSRGGASLTNSDGPLDGSGSLLVVTGRVSISGTSSSDSDSTIDNSDMIDSDLLSSESGEAGIVTDVRYGAVPWLGRGDSGGGGGGVMAYQQSDGRRGRGGDVASVTHTTRSVYTEGYQGGGMQGTGVGSSAAQTSRSPARSLRPQQPPPQPLQQGQQHVQPSTAQEAPRSADQPTSVTHSSIAPQPQASSAAGSSSSAAARLPSLGLPAIRSRFAQQGTISQTAADTATVSTAAELPAATAMREPPAAAAHSRRSSSSSGDDAAAAVPAGGSQLAQLRASAFSADAADPHSQPATVQPTLPQPSSNITSSEAHTGPANDNKSQRAVSIAGATIERDPSARVASTISAVSTIDGLVRLGSPYLGSRNLGSITTQASDTSREGSAVRGWAGAAGAGARGLSGLPGYAANAFGTLDEGAYGEDEEGASVLIGSVEPSMSSRNAPSSSELVAMSTSSGSRLAMATIGSVLAAQTSQQASIHTKQDDANKSTASMQLHDNDSDNTTDNNERTSMDSGYGVATGMAAAAGMQPAAAVPAAASAAGSVLARSGDSSVVFGTMPSVMGDEDAAVFAAFAGVSTSQ